MKSVLPFSVHEVECGANSEVPDKEQNEFVTSKDWDPCYLFVLPGGV